MIRICLKTLVHCLQSVEDIVVASSVYDWNSSESLMWHSAQDGLPSACYVMMWRCARAAYSYLCGHLCNGERGVSGTYPSVYVLHLLLPTSGTGQQRAKVGKPRGFKIVMGDRS